MAQLKAAPFQNKIKTRISSASCSTRAIPGNRQNGALQFAEKLTVGRLRG
jgi:hypothetical protein